MIRHICGGVAEWLNAPVLKTGGPKGLEGSNPSPSASISPLFTKKGDNMAFVIIILAIAAALALFYINIRNGIVVKDNRCDNAWQTIDAQL